MEPPTPAPQDNHFVRNFIYGGLGLFCALPLLLSLLGGCLFVSVLILERTGFTFENSSTAATILMAGLVIICWAAMFVGSAALATWLGLRRKPPASELPPDEPLPPTS